MRAKFLWTLLAVLCYAPLAHGLNAFVTNPAAKPVNVILRDTSGNYVDASGGGGGGGGDASAANQTSQITQATATNTVLGGKTDAKSTATDATSISIMQVLKQISASVQAPPTQAVTNAGTFATQSVATQKQLTGVPSNFTIGTSDGTVFTLAAGEIGFIQNLHTTALAVKKGASASTTSLNFGLSGGTAQDDFKGGYVQINDWIGAVSVAAMTGSPRFIAWKQAP